MLWDVGNGTGRYATGGAKEGTIVTNICKAIEDLYGKSAVVFKVHGSLYQRSGYPDIHVTFKGRDIWIECKRPGGDTTALQHNKLNQLAYAGAFVGTATSVTEALEMMDRIENLIK